jgi:hypothetical protein
LKCPACREKFKYDVTNGWPDECPICKTDINNRRDDDDVVMPNILSFRTKNNDKVARDIMDGSEKRAEIAAQMAGTSVEEMSNLKITNLNDRNDTQFSAVEVNNPVTQRMAEMQAKGMPTGFGVAQAQEFAAAAHVDTFAQHAGAKEMSRMQRLMNPIGQAPLPNEITRNPNYRRPI